jgi:polyisoprenyl-phosphate glycosyltransferase
MQLSSNTPSSSSASEERVLGSLVVPVYNEEANISPFFKKIEEVLVTNRHVAFEIIFVNDGSSDSTLEKLLAHHSHNFRIVIVDLSRNFGKEAALTAGLTNASGDFVVPIDIDLQDPPELIVEMIQKWEDGYEVVEGRRIDRSTDSFLKRNSAKLYYALHNSVSELKITGNVGDFRLMDKRVVEAILSLPESQRFMKGLFAWVGFRTTTIDYARNARTNGETKFATSKLVNLALQGLTSFSISPLRIWTYLGLVVSLFSISWAIYIVVRSLIFGIDAPGYASTIAAITILGGLQLIGIGVLGEYLGRTYMESKRRPSHIVRQIHRKP